MRTKRVQLTVDEQSALENYSTKGAWIDRGGAAADCADCTQIVVGGDADDSVLLAGGGWAYRDDVQAVVHVYTSDAVKVHLLIDTGLMVF